MLKVKANPYHWLLKHKKDHGLPHQTVLDQTARWECMRQPQHEYLDRWGKI